MPNPEEIRILSTAAWFLLICVTTPTKPKEDIDDTMSCIGKGISDGVQTLPSAQDKLVEVSIPS